MKNDYQLPNMGGVTIANRLTVRLMEELRAGEFAGVVRLPSEMELAEKYGVSRSVIRDVMSNLEREGYVERGRGVGTVVNRDIVKLNNRLDLKFEYNDLILGAGAQPGCDNVKVSQKAADEALAEKLELDVGSPVLVVEKRMLASGRPVIFSVDTLPLALFGGTQWQTLDWSASIFSILQEGSGVLVDTNITRLLAVTGPPAVRQKLQVAEGEALVLLDEVGYYKLTRPILHTEAYYTNFFEFTMLRKLFQ